MSLLHDYRMTMIEDDTDRCCITLSKSNWIRIMTIVQQHEYETEHNAVLRELAEQYEIVRNLTK